MSPKSKNNANKDSYNFYGEVKQSVVGPNGNLIINDAGGNNNEQMTQELLALLSELRGMLHENENLSKEDLKNVEKDIHMVESQIQKLPDKSNTEIIFKSIKEMNGILAKATKAGIVLKQVFDIAQTLFHR